MTITSDAEDIAVITQPGVNLSGRVVHLGAIRQIDRSIRGPLAH